MPWRGSVVARAQSPAPAAPTTPGRADALTALARIFSNAAFDASPRSRTFLRFVVEEALAGRQDGLTQDAIATGVFQRPEGFDPTIDPIVRIQAGRLRQSLERYYLLAGAEDPVRIDLPRGAYAPTMRWAAHRPRVVPDRGPVDDWPSVVVLPVETTSTESVAARFRRMLVLELGRYRDVRVVLCDGRPREVLSSHEYELATRISCDQGGSSATVLLVDRRTRGQLWAQEYRGAPGAADDFYEEKARVVAGRVASEHGVVAQSLWAEQRKSPPDRPTAYGAVLRSYQFLFNRDPADFKPALDSLRRAVAAEPECALAWVQLARLHCVNIANEHVLVDPPVPEALDCAQRGVRLDPTGPRARSALAYALLLQGEIPAARAEARKALDLNPESLVYLETIGWLLALSGEWEHGLALVRDAVERNPHGRPIAFHALWADHLRRGEMAGAYQAALRYSDAVFWQPLARACCLGHLGRPADAAHEVGELLAMKPDFARRGRDLIGRLFKQPDLLETVVDGLAKAGLRLD